MSKAAYDKIAAGLDAALIMAKAPPMAMIERVARAIYEGRNGKGAAPWGRLPASHKAPYLVDGRAAIAAMREPGNSMIDAALAE
jgi:hypothetical protein